MPHKILSWKTSPTTVLQLSQSPTNFRWAFIPLWTFVGPYLYNKVWWWFELSCSKNECRPVTLKIPSKISSGLYRKGEVGPVTPWCRALCTSRLHGERMTWLWMTAAGSLTWNFSRRPRLDGSRIVVQDRELACGTGCREDVVKPLSDVVKPLSDVVDYYNLWLFAEQNRDVYRVRGWML